VIESGTSTRRTREERKKVKQAALAVVKETPSKRNQGVAKRQSTGQLVDPSISMFDKYNRRTLFGKK